MQYKKSSVTIAKQESIQLTAKELVDLRTAEVARLEAALKEVEESTDDVSASDLDDPESSETRELCKVDFASVK